MSGEIKVAVVRTRGAIFFVCTVEYKFSDRRLIIYYYYYYKGLLAGVETDSNVNPHQRGWWAMMIIIKERKKAKQSNEAPPRTSW